MQIVMMGTGPFAVPTFRALYETRHRIVALATAPLRTHRGKPVEPISSIREVAREHGTPILDPEDVNTPESQARLAEYNADLLVVCDYGQILVAGHAGHGPVAAASICTPRSCRSIAARRRSIGPSTTATPKPA